MSCDAASRMFRWATYGEYSINGERANLSRVVGVHYGRNYHCEIAEDGHAPVFRYTCFAVS